MHIAKELGKSIEEVMQFSVLEIQLWASYFKIQRDSQQRGMNRGGKHKNRTGSRR